MYHDWRDRRRACERWLKMLVIRTLGLLMRSSSPRPPPDWGARPHRVLYLRYDRIGDMVLATGIIRAIVAAQPTVTVDVLASSRNADVLRGNPHVGRVLTIDKSRPWTFVAAILSARRTGYDAALDAMVTAPSLTTMLLMWACGARHRIGVGDRGNRFALTLPVARISGAIHYVDRSAALLAAFGVDVGRMALERQRAAQAVAKACDAAPSPLRTGWGIWRPEIHLLPGELRQGEAHWRAVELPADGNPSESLLRLLVNVSAGSAWRYWPDEHFVAAMRSIRERFACLSILLVGVPADEERMARIGRGAGVPLVRTAHYREMMAIVAASDFALTADTAVTHIASAFGKPAVAMFPRGEGAWYGPYGTAGCSVCTQGSSLESLGVDPVIRALEAMIAAEHPPTARSPRYLSSRTHRSRSSAGSAPSTNTARALIAGARLTAESLAGSGSSTGGARACRAGRDGFCAVEWRPRSKGRGEGSAVSIDPS